MRSLQENVRILTQAMTQAFLMMGQIMNQAVSRNPPLSHYEPSSFGSPITSSLSCEGNSQRNPNLENYQLSLRDTVKTTTVLRQWERKKHITHFNLKT